ncbi:hypothetical protein SDC9_47117 [bioreactor metagenome]|jgi:hypothetical protein|uniref:Uncharacterized protein n=1 Tax=bioreactor metagenome TaxID=1076179 RepID=A0A644WEZ8_9ZZZZ|nr:hypothetical protein [Aminivibrio sp.]MDD3515339.1 hypothetical protein [Synergistaceae bacterium]NCB14942.1 hypothetical protein [Synergistales bacterium]MEA4951478.1 hypothetical protein [Aminivibrio sp.]HPF84331.1 hypothetical protein [Aminivibrio sp.]HRX25630.1 hypothetical protein [Aminivibrio sp.]
MTSLPYWDSNVDMQIAPWFPLGVDYKPVSVNSHHSGRLSRIAALSMRLSSEFFCLTSLQSGYAGTLLRDSMFIPGKQRRIDFGFTMLFGYSAAMEEAVGALIESQGDIEGGVSFCTLWDRDIILESFKAIILVSGNPFFSEDEFLDRLGVALEKSVSTEANMPFFAEKFGYRRFFIPYETDNPVDLEISRLLYEMEFEETRKWVGPSPEVSFPPFLTLDLAVD